MCSLPSLMVGAAAVGSIGFAIAAETPIDLNTDIKGRYFVVEKTGTPDHPSVVVKRVAPDGRTYYIKRLFDCKARTVRYLGEGETQKAMAGATPDPKPTPIEEGTIPDQLARQLCPK